MAEPSETAVGTIDVTLRPVEQSNQPLSANYSTVGVAQGIAYLDFGFLEPAELAGAVRNLRSGNGTPDSLECTLVVRVAMGLEVVQRLQQQLQQVLAGLRRQPTMKG